jgi:uncharacterized RmlC-like cupin family protein
VNVKETRDILDECQKNTTHYVFKKFFMDTPTWDEIFEHLSYEYFKEPAIEVNESWSVNNGVISRYGSFYIQIRDAKFHKKYNVVADFFNKVFNDKSPGGAVWIDLVAGKPKIELHTDDWENNLHWQVIGTTTWEFSKTKEGPVTTIELNAGDVVYIPNGLYHSVRSDTPRCGMIVPYHIKNKES